ncbi:cupin domain-containing protein [Streptomyces sp. NPDC006739]|uniref:cupin domain-containing protein n=1 Tax=Streptomyces sp. NPDC006739 TaxID=3364763 RepID=UPI0036AB23A5
MTGEPRSTPRPRILCDTGSLSGAGDDATGAVWRLAEPGRQLDANVVRIAPGRRVDTHTEPDLDVLLLVVAGEGTLVCLDGSEPLGPGTTAWLPHGSTRALVAGAAGLSYLTVHRRRPGMRIQRLEGAGQAPALTGADEGV